MVLRTCLSQTLAQGHTIGLMRSACLCCKQWPSKLRLHNVPSTECDVYARQGKERRSEIRGCTRHDGPQIVRKRDCLQPVTAVRKAHPATICTSCSRGLSGSLVSALPVPPIDFLLTRRHVHVHALFDLCFMEPIQYVPREEPSEVRGRVIGLYQLFAVLAGIA